MTHAHGSGPTTRPGAPRRQAWSTPKTIFRPRTTRAISKPPRSRRTTPAGPQTETPGFGLLNDPEPLPYVQPGGRHAMTSYGAEPAEYGPDIDAQSHAADRRGTQDLGLLVLRLGVGAILIVHGLQKAFGLWGGPGLDGWGDSLTAMGFKYADILTYVTTGRPDRRGPASGAWPVHPGGGGGRAGIPGDRPAGGGDGRARRGQAGVCSSPTAMSTRCSWRARSRRSS